MKTSQLFLYITYLIALALVWFSRDNCFFWDTIQLGSQHAQFYFTNDFSRLILPVEIDSGHIPAFGMYIALMWSVFGKSLLVSHFAILPFSIGIVWQLQKLCASFIENKHVGIVVFIVFIDPTLMSQVTLVSPDIPLIFFFLLALNSSISNKKMLLSISVCFLFLISMRGMMLSLCIVFIDIYINFGYDKFFKIQKLISIVKRSIIYFPALLIFLVFNYIHYQKTGWIGYHDKSPWASCFESVDTKGFFINIAILLWRILDFGRIGIWIVALILLFAFKNKIFLNKKQTLLLFSFIVILFLFPINMLWAKNLLAHRYILPVYLVFSLLISSILFSSLIKRKVKNILILIWIMALVTGNLWKYPEKIAMGWDSTLGHLPYYNLRKQAITYLNSNKIDAKDVTSFFPNYYTFTETDLINDNKSFSNFTLLSKSKYVFYSNVFNTEDNLYDFMKKSYHIKKRYKNLGIHVDILERNK